MQFVHSWNVGPEGIHDLYFSTTLLAVLAANAGLATSNMFWLSFICGAASAVCLTFTCYICIKVFCLFGQQSIKARLPGLAHGSTWKLPPFKSCTPQDALTQLGPH